MVLLEAIQVSRFLYLPRIDFCDRLNSTGIQDTPNGHVIIYSLWDPSATVEVTSVLYAEPGATTERFGGEGTGYHFISNPSKGGTGWNLNTWYTLVTRCWDNGQHTSFGLWVFDSVNWHYLVTIDYPYKGARFNYGATSFLENYGSSDLAGLRKMSTQNGWKRSTAGWGYFLQGSFDVGTTGGVSGNTFYMATQNGLAANINSANSNQKVSSIFFDECILIFIYIFFFLSSFQVPKAATTQPVLPSLTITSFTAQYNPQTQRVTISWTIDSSRSPQFSYSIKLYNSNSPSTVVSSSSSSAPQVRSVLLSTTSLPAGAYLATLQLVDVLDVASALQTTAFSTVFGPTASPSVVPSSVVPSLPPSYGSTRLPTGPTVRPSRSPSSKSSFRPTSSPSTTSTNFPTIIPTSLMPSPSVAASFSLTGPVTFDGTSTFLHYPPLSPALGAAFSISLWVNPTSTSSEAYLLSLGRSPTNFDGELILEISNSEAYYWEYGQGNYGVSLTSPTSIPQGSSFFFSLL